MREEEKENEKEMRGKGQSSILTLLSHLPALVMMIMMMMMMMVVMVVMITMMIKVRQTDRERHNVTNLSSHPRMLCACSKFHGPRILSLNMMPSRHPVNLALVNTAGVN